MPRLGYAVVWPASTGRLSSRPATRPTSGRAASRDSTGLASGRRISQRHQTGPTKNSPPSSIAATSSGAQAAEPVLPPGDDRREAQPPGQPRRGEPPGERIDPQASLEFGPARPVGSTSPRRPRRRESPAPGRPRTAATPPSDRDPGQPEAPAPGWSTACTAPGAEPAQARQLQEHKEAVGPPARHGRQGQRHRHDQPPGGQRSIPRRGHRPTNARINGTTPT